MARIAGVNVPTNKRVLVALTYVHGIGLTSSKNLCKNYNLILWDIKFSKKFSSDIKKLSVKYNSSVTLHKVDIPKKNNRH